MATFRWRKPLVDLVEDRRFSRTIIALILINAAILGMETSPTLVAKYGFALHSIDQAILFIFVVELGLRIAAYRGQFFRDPWSLFDTAVIAVALVPANDAFSVLRALRVLRVLRLISALPQLRMVLQGLISAIPGLSSIGALLTIFLYVYAVMAAKLFGEQYPELFGNLIVSLFTLFQIMTLDGWSEIVRRLDHTHPYAGLFFTSYILLSTFTVLNLLIAVMVNAINSTTQDDRVNVEDTHTASITAVTNSQHHEDLSSKVVELNRKLDTILARLPVAEQAQGRNIQDSLR